MQRRSNSRSTRVSGLLPWVSMTLKDMCFLSWDIPAIDIRRTLPPSVQVEHHQGTSYVTAVAFRVDPLRVPGTPKSRAGFSYLELNLRTYVTHKGKPGIWWLSVDATFSRAHAWAAAHLFKVPCYRSNLRMDMDGSMSTFTSARSDSAAPARFDLRYSADPKDEAREPSPDSLEGFICRRHIAFSSRLKSIWRLQVHRSHWRTQPVAWADVDASGLFTATGLPVPRSQPVAYFSPGSDVVMLPPVPAGLTARRMSRSSTPAETAA